MNTSSATSPSWKITHGPYTQEGRPNAMFLHLGSHFVHDGVYSPPEHTAWSFARQHPQTRLMYGHYPSPDLFSSSFPPPRFAYNSPTHCSSCPSLTSYNNTSYHNAANTLGAAAYGIHCLSNRHPTPRQTHVCFPEVSVNAPPVGTSCTSPILPLNNSTACGKLQNLLTQWGTPVCPNTSLEPIGDISAASIATTSTGIEDDFTPLSPTGFDPPPTYTSDIPSFVQSTAEPTDILAAAVATITENVDKAKTAPLRQTKPAKKPKPKLLGAAAVAVMTEWFNLHINHPYPTPAEKQAMADQGGITFSQVNSWFNNKRNRSSNTAPKRQKRKMEEKIAGLCHKMVSSENANSSEIVQSLHSLIQENNGPPEKRRKL